VQTNPTSSPPSSTNEIDEEQINRIDTMDLRQIVNDHDNANIFLTIDQTKQEDENNNDKIDQNLIQISCSSSDEELDTNLQLTNNNLFNSNTESTTEQQPSSDQNLGEDLPHTTTNLSTDNDNISKR
jgi:hypothetical protein